MAAHKGIHALDKLGITGAIILTVSAFLKETNFLWQNVYFHILTIFFIIIFLFELLSKKFILKPSTLSATIRGIIYIALPLSYLFPAHNLENGSYFIFIIASSIALNDIFAYLIGKNWGKTKLSSLSPKKTLEGYLAGFIASILVITIGLHIYITLNHALILGALVGLLAPPSDLFESFLKRYFDVKDSGTILPGHGGILDRIDSFIFLIPLCYIYLFWIIKIKPL